ncbi:hypothetical protein CBR_g18647 [Chara braunii]|uniref:Uncharacterized protein n=1 Tax=Chara braunii TaxID=69332 RepID=A0A388JTD8_CHABU|nr:hypothetical protein CBR_g18647 [Chara braunii]|eukprot:GBG61055.1 hypothetical protein CBR_g18647 [Chara braunii]
MAGGIPLHDKAVFSVGGGIDEREVEDVLPFAAMLFSAVFFAEALARLFSYMFPVRRPSKTEQSIWKQYKALEREADTLTTPDTFVEGARKRRLANAKKKELENYRRMKATKLSAWKVARIVMPYVIRWGAYIYLAYSFWHFPISVLPAELLVPVGRMLSFPEDRLWVKNGGVSIIPFLSMSSLVASSFLASLGSIRK